MAVVRFKFTSPVSGNTTPAVGWLGFEPTARRVIVGDPDNIVLPIPFSASLVSGAVDVDLAQTGTDWVWKVTEHIAGQDPVSYFVAVPSGAGPVDAPDLVKVTPGDYTPIDTTKNVSLAGLDARVDALEAGGGGSGAVSSVNSKTGAVVLNASDVGAAPASHTHTAAQISDSTATGRSVVTAADAAAARTAIGAGTSNLAIGTTAGTAAAGNHTHNASDVNAGVLAVARLGSGTPAAGKYVDGGTGAWTTLPAGGGGGYTGMPLASGDTVILNPGASGTTNAAGAGTVEVFPIYIPAAITAQTIAVNVSTAAAAGSTAVLGYYTRDTSGSFTLGATFGTIDTTATGLKSITGPFTLPAGVIFIAILNLNAAPGYTSTNAWPGLPGPVAINGNSFTSTPPGWRLATGRATLPATGSGAPQTDYSQVPRFQVTV